MAELPSEIAEYLARSPEIDLDELPFAELSREEGRDLLASMFVAAMTAAVRLNSTDRGPAGRDLLDLAQACPHFNSESLQRAFRWTRGNFGLQPEKFIEPGEIHEFLIGSLAGTVGYDGRQRIDAIVAIAEMRLGKKLPMLESLRKIVDVEQEDSLAVMSNMILELSRRTSSSQAFGRKTKLISRIRRWTDDSR